MRDQVPDAPQAADRSLMAPAFRTEIEGHIATVQNSATRADMRRALENIEASLRRVRQWFLDARLISLLADGERLSRRVAAEQAEAEAGLRRISLSIGQAERLLLGMPTRQELRFLRDAFAGRPGHKLSQDEARQHGAVGGVRAVPHAPLRGDGGVGRRRNGRAG